MSYSVSSSSSTCVSRSDHVEVTCSVPVRDDTAQLIRRNRSPGRYARTSAGSVPSPCRCERCSPTVPPARGTTSTPVKSAPSGSVVTGTGGDQVSARYAPRRDVRRRSADHHLVAPPAQRPQRDHHVDRPASGDGSARRRRRGVDPGAGIDGGGDHIARQVVVRGDRSPWPSSSDPRTSCAPPPAASRSTATCVADGAHPRRRGRGTVRRARRCRRVRPPSAMTTQPTATQTARRWACVGCHLPSGTPDRVIGRAGRSAAPARTAGRHG